MQAPASFTVTADDTTGALETAAACADAGHGARAVHHAGRLDRSEGVAGVVVVDLRSRHLPPEVAAARLRDVVARTGATQAHKIDSTLRGNWPVEVATLVSLGRQVLLVPAFPRAGRTCVGGVVLVDGVPVHETAFGRDPRRAVRSSRPADLLGDAALPAVPPVEVVEVAGVAGARTAVEAGVPVVIGDASSDDHLASYAALARSRPDVVIVGPAAVVAAAAGEATTRVPRARPTGSRAIVVSASRHPAALGQLAGVRARGIEVVEPPVDARADDADRVLARLAHDAHRSLAADPRIDVLFVIGGDTAAAVLGEAEVDVDGTLDVGVAHGEVVLDGRRLRLITKPGGFGSADTVTDVLDQVLR